MVLTLAINCISQGQGFPIVFSGHTSSFLANDVTLVTSYGYCQSLKINDRRCTYVRTCDVCLTICEAGGIFCETMGGGVHRDTESLTLSAAQTHTANVMGVRPPGL